MDRTSQDIYNVLFEFGAPNKQPCLTYAYTVDGIERQACVTPTMLQSGSVRVQDILAGHESRMIVLGITMLFISPENLDLYQAWRRHCQILRNRQLAV